MTPKEFNEAIKSDNKAYRTLFGYIPCIADFSCSRHEYVLALKEAIKSQKELKYIIPSYTDTGTLTPGSEI